MRAIHATRGEKLLGADDSELFAKLVPNQILAAVSAGEREICGLRATTALKPGDQICVFIVRMRPDQKNAPHVISARLTHGAAANLRAQDERRRK